VAKAKRQGRQVTRKKIRKEARSVLLGGAYLFDLGAWTQHAVARDIRRRAVPWDDDTAVCWCAVGVLNAQGASKSVRHECYRAIERVAGERCMPILNDSTSGMTASKMADIFRRAAKTLR
jgi:hypothetical protein